MGKWKDPSNPTTQEASESLGNWGQPEVFSRTDAGIFHEHGGTKEQYEAMTPAQRAHLKRMLTGGTAEFDPNGPMPGSTLDKWIKTGLPVAEGADGTPGATSAGADGSLYAQLLKQSGDAGKFETEQRLDPTWNNRENAMRARLLNQGLDPTSEASQNAMGQFGRDRNDAYASALNASQDGRYRNALNTWIADQNVKMGVGNNQQQQLADLLQGAGSAATSAVNALAKWKPSPADGTVPIGYDNSGTPYYSNPSDWENPFPYSGG